MRFLFALASLILASCASDSGGGKLEAAAEKPQRIISLDYCADQYVLKLADRNNILALSLDADKPFSYMRDQAKGIKRIRPDAEAVLALKPDLILRSYGGGPNASTFYEGLGIKVHDLGYAANLADIPPLITAAADAMGESAKGDRLITEMEERLVRLQNKLGEERRPSLLYVTSAGVTTGVGGMINEMIESAGFDNFVKISGWRSLPLEALTHEKPDAIAAAFYSDGQKARDQWSPSRHPIVKNTFEEAEIISLDGASLSCAGWYVLDAFEALNTSREAYK